MSTPKPTPVVILERATVGAPYVIAARSRGWGQAQQTAGSLREERPRSAFLIRATDGAEEFIATDAKTQASR